MNLGWLENVFLQPPLYLLSPRGSCQARAWIHVALRTSLSWRRSHGPIQDLLGAAENPPSSHLTKKRNLRKYLPCCLTHPSLIYYARSSPSTWRRRESPLHVWDSRADLPTISSWSPAAFLIAGTGKPVARNNSTKCSHRRGLRLCQMMQKEH